MTVVATCALVIGGIAALLASDWVHARESEAEAEEALLDEVSATLE
ncbi:MAG TPA: hypothetical protein IAD14_03180 [Candidatus Coprousia avicola]|nr:hypothetical protein [Candidatus Coprousia avicola]